MIRSAFLVKLFSSKLRTEQTVQFYTKTRPPFILYTVNGHYTTIKKNESFYLHNPHQQRMNLMFDSLKINARMYTKGKGKSDGSPCTIVDQPSPIQIGKDERVSLNREASEAHAHSVVDEPKMEPKVELKVDPMVGPMVEPKVETKVETKAKVSAEGTKAVKKQYRSKFDHSYKSTERNFVTAIRAMNEYLLKPIHLDQLRKIYRRSPFEDAPQIAMYLRKDVEAKAHQVYGSKEALARELKKKQEEDRQYKEYLFQIKMTVKDYQEQNEMNMKKIKQQDSLFRGSGRVVLTAITINACNFTLKLLAWMYTGSHSLFSEAIHSFADTVNQLILAYGIHKSIQAADYDHPYGYMNIRYVASLISGVGIFCFGTGLSIYHGIIGLVYPEPTSSLYWAFFILAGSLVSEGATLLVAFNAIRKGAKKTDMSVKEYILRAQDPLVNVVLLEDIAAVLGVSIAATCMGLSTVLESTVPDAVGSILIGGLLGVVAAVIISTNTTALVGRSIPFDKLEKINRELETDVMIRAIHDAKCMDLGNGRTRYKAEIDFDGRELTRAYLDKQDFENLLDEMRKMTTMEEVETFMLRHGENVIDMVGAEIDRIETSLKKRHPEIRHCDLEIL